MFRYGLFVCLTVVLTAVIGYATLATARLLRTWKPDRNLLLMPAENGIRLIILVALILLGILGEVPFSTLGWTLKNVRHEAVMGALWGAGIALFFFVATAWIYQKQVPGHFYSTVLIEAILPTSVSEGALVCLAMIPAVLVEELLFRSLLLGGFSPLVSPLLLLGITSLLFGSLHSSQGIWGIAGASLGGLLFGSLFLWRGSIVAPVVAHYLANILQIFIALRWFKPKAG